MFAGFSIGGIDWLWPDLADAQDQEAKVERIAKIGFEDTRLTHSMGGNIIRIFFNLGHILSPFSAVPLDMSGLSPRFERPWYLLPEEEKLAVCDDVMAFLASAQAALRVVPPDGDGLQLWDLDAYIQGVTCYWESTGQARPPVRVLLTHVILPPVPILEAPRDAILSARARHYRFGHLWGSYCEIHAKVARMLARRYAVAPKRASVVCAFEIANEPDYEWLPDELRIEKSARPEVNAVRKYITELHNSQIPDSVDPAPPQEPTAWGGFRGQEGPWTECDSRRPARVIEFDWGQKFDWYVRCYAEYAEHFSYAIWHETRSNGCDTDVISAGVTHNNLDYLLRMYRANPHCFDYCSGIGLHPYHWPAHDIYDARFQRGHEPDAWRSASPRTFAFDHFKCFDFFSEVSRLTRETGERAYGMAGKEIWLTEFGIPTKLPGSYNGTSEFVPFIRPRALPADALPHPCAVWEDLWDAFFDQVQPVFLAAHGVRALVFYTLRESAVPAFDKHDDDRSNFAILRRNGLPRMDQLTIDRFTRFMADTTGVLRAAADVSFAPMPAWGRWKDYSAQLLRFGPWQATLLPTVAANCVSMLTSDEKRLLYWMTSEYFSGAGAIIDAGCFVGGSTVSLASGLASAQGGDTWRERAKIHSYDLFLTDDYMRIWYFERNKLETEGNRFRNLFDTNTAQWCDLLEVGDGDITKLPWTGGPIEILFIDICKLWHVNDYVTREFFPQLIPGRSLVIQQDFFHHREYWIIITHEILQEFFEYIGFVKWNSAVFRCVKPVDPAVIPPALRDLGLPELDRQFRRHIARYENPYQLGMLSCALAFLHLDFGNVRQAREIHAEVSHKYASEYWVAEAVKDLAAELEKYTQ
jgi:hypothetical protein